MELIYRGTRYQVDHPSLDLITLGEQGTFLGARFSRKHYPNGSHSLGQNPLTYRGVRYYR